MSPCRLPRSRPRAAGPAGARPAPPAPPRSRPHPRPASRSRLPASVARRPASWSFLVGRVRALPFCSPSGALSPAPSRPAPPGLLSPPFPAGPFPACGFARSSVGPWASRSSLPARPSFAAAAFGSFRASSFLRRSRALGCLSSLCPSRALGPSPASARSPPIALLCFFSRLPLVRASSETAVCCQPRPGKREGNPGLCPRGAFRVGPDPRRRGHLLPAGARAARLERRGAPGGGGAQSGRGPGDRPCGVGSELGATSANPCPEVTDLTCRLPLPTLIYRPEAEHLGDLLRSKVKVLNNHHRPCGGGACPLDLHPTGIALLSAWSVRRAKREAHCGAAHNAAAPSSSSAGGSARDTKRLFARCSTANRWRSQQRGLLPTDHNLTYGCYGQRPPLKVNELGGLQQPKKEKKALPRATAGVGERVRLLPSTHTGLRTTGSKIRDSKGGWLPARPRTLFCSFFLFSKLSRKPWRWKPIVKPLDRPDPTTTSRVGGGRGRFFSTPVFRGGRGGAYSESEGEVVVHTVTVRGSPSPQAGETGEVGKRAGIGGSYPRAKGRLIHDQAMLAGNPPPLRSTRVRLARAFATTTKIRTSGGSRPARAVSFYAHHRALLLAGASRPPRRSP
ncbi:hypothetical protein C7M84_018096 [Penaeus vannamei]|uniref:Uncharacterized protein n=1 Tax=Penaeus vannamei TaxID=6689 RepID=A0A3R7M0H4_PENVA|nr:hypothetical protein C7M84_018096 [Penaeus vannamei]